MVDQQAYCITIISFDQRAKYATRDMQYMFVLTLNVNFNQT